MSAVFFGCSAKTRIMFNLLNYPVHGASHGMKSFDERARHEQFNAKGLA